MLAPPACQTGEMERLVDRLASARLYLVCGEMPEAFLEGALRGGVDLVQLRCKDAAEDRILAAARELLVLAHRHGVPLLLNDRPDLVHAAGADGAHVGQDDIDVAEARRLIGPERLLGLSTHSPEQIDAAGGLSLDYIGIGPVHGTPTKPGRPAVGLGLVRYASQHAALPFFAIGGISTANIGDVVGAGASRIAVVRALTEARDPARAARALRAGLLGTPARTEAQVGAT